MKYKLKEIRPDIFAVFVKDKYERAMLFFRVQEFYESPGKAFRGSKFSIWDYFRWYAKKKGCFSYPKDFSGFNLPLVVAKKCYEVNGIESPYDELMKGIVDKVFVNGRRQYLIGADESDSCTLMHELAHGLYYTNMEYKEVMDGMTENLPKTVVSTLRKNLLGMGYCREVVKDEIQAYFSTESDPVIGKGVRGRKKIHKRYKAAFKKYEQ
jgi:hypothetical protein